MTFGATRTIGHKLSRGKVLRINSGMAQTLCSQGFTRMLLLSLPRRKNFKLKEENIICSISLS